LADLGLHLARVFVLSTGIGNRQHHGLYLRAGLRGGGSEIVREGGNAAPTRRIGADERNRESCLTGLAQAVALFGPGERVLLELPRRSRGAPYTVGREGAWVG